jgi:hypothetical protein
VIDFILGGVFACASRASEKKEGKGLVLVFVVSSVSVLCVCVCLCARDVISRELSRFVDPYLLLLPQKEQKQQQT